MDKARQFAKDNVVECSAEILNWNSSGTLSGNKLMELGTILKELETHHYLTIAQNLVQNEALKIVAKQEGVDIPDVALHARSDISFKTQ